ncbi:MAG: acyl-CoA thioesterase [Acidobacteria bacterium]|nr:acyl-CoA thioesterase [Acidobacteriota bacterium]
MDKEKEAKEVTATATETFENKHEVAIRITMMPRDTNAHGTVFGGIILSYIDVAGGVEAVRHTGHDRFVTVAMKEIIFLEPVFVGDLVSFYAETVKVGNSSTTIRVVVEAQRVGSHGQSIRVTQAEVVYVAINQYREKVKISK